MSLATWVFTWILKFIFIWASTIFPSYNMQPEQNQNTQIKYRESRNRTKREINGRKDDQETITHKMLIFKN